MQGLALCQMAPGGHVSYMLSTYIGYRLRGIWGAFVCAVAFVIPAFLLLVVSATSFKLGDLWYIKGLFKGLGAMVVAIVLNALINFGKPILKDWKVVLIALLSFVAFLLRWNTVLVFILAAGAAFIFRPATGKAGPLPSPAGVGQKSSVREPYLFLAVLAVILGGLWGICYSLNAELSYLFLALSKVGALAFGGGFTIIPLIQYEVVDKFHWVNTKEFLDGIAMGQVTPGPVMITATFLGYKMAGFWGAVMATIGIFAPPFFIISLLIPNTTAERGAYYPEDGAGHSCGLHRDARAGSL